MKDYLKIIRWPNLLMIFIMQILLRYALIQPILLLQGKSVLMNPFEFLILVFSCVFIAAGGYLINDIEDVEIDTINKPDKVLIGKNLQLDSVYNLYMIFTFIGVLGGFYLSFIKGYKYIGIINLVIAGFLYFYATSYKCIPLLGNLIIAMLTAFSVWIVIIPEPFALADSAVVSMVSGYTGFAFLLTLVRELLKDLQDFKGDNECGCKTLPVSVGIKFTKFLSILLTIIILLLIGGIQWLSEQWNNPFPFYYLLCTVEIPLLVLIPMIYKANNVNSFARVSIITKMIMFTGVISMLLFYFSFQ